MGIAAIRAVEYYTKIQEKIIATRERTAAALRNSGWEVLPSMANFIFIKHQHKSGKELYNTFRDAGILVRHFKTPGIENFIRVTIGTDDEIDRFLQACGTIGNE